MLFTWNGVSAVSEWGICSQVLLLVWDLWFTLTVDLFATQFNHRLPISVTPVQDPAALAISTFAISWSGILAIACPPLPIVGRVIWNTRVDQSR